MYCRTKSSIDELYCNEQSYNQTCSVLDRKQKLVIRGSVVKHIYGINNIYYLLKFRSMTIYFVAYEFFTCSLLILVVRQKYVTQISFVR